MAAGSVISPQNQPAASSLIICNNNLHVPFSDFAVGSGPFYINNYTLTGLEEETNFTAHWLQVLIWDVGETDLSFDSKSGSVGT